MKNEIEGLADRLLGANICLEEAVEILERSMIEGALELHRGNQSAASRHLGIHRNTLQRKVVEYELGNGRAKPRRKPVTRARAKSGKKRGAA